jgi:predicted methyltransferase
MAPARALTAPTVAASIALDQTMIAALIAMPSRAACETTVNGSRPTFALLISAVTSRAVGARLDGFSENFALRQRL